MTKKNLGRKRICINPKCDSPFYDLNKSPIECPYCGQKATNTDFFKLETINYNVNYSSDNDSSSSEESSPETPELTK